MTTTKKIAFQQNQRLSILYSLHSTNILTYPAVEFVVTIQFRYMGEESRFLHYHPETKVENMVTVIQSQNALRYSRTPYNS